MQNSAKTIYEQPLNERIRAFLRLEHLFVRAVYRLEGPSIWDSRLTLEAILDILALLTRADLKSEIIKELERHAGTLEGLRSNPGVDPRRLGEVLEEVKATLRTLKAYDVSPGQELRSNDLLSAVRQRSSIPAGTCSFDVPAFQHWLERPAEQRIADLQGWLSEFDLVRDAVVLCLRLIRQSARGSRERAEGGFFQRNMDPTVQCQLVRVVLPDAAPWFPEISGGRHRFTVRFMEVPEGASRPAQTADNVEFDLLCCMM